MKPNVSYPFGDGNAPDNLPVVDEPISLMSPWVTLDGAQIARNELANSSVDFQALGEGFSLSLFQSE